jgi:hypothetical protein
MADHTENSLRAVVKALTDVVGPAVDKSDPLANEQLRLVVDYIEFVRNRLDFYHGRERFELRHHLAMAAALDGLRTPCSAATAGALSSAIAAGRHAYALAASPTPALKAATARLAAAIGALVREAQGFDGAVRRQVELQVLEATEERVRFERSWYQPLGFDPSPGENLPLAAVLAEPDAAAAP